MRKLLVVLLCLVLVFSFVACDVLHDLINSDNSTAKDPDDNELDNSDTPNTPENPDNPDNPESPDKPESPDTPESPDKPESPDIPETPDTPDNPESPDKPESPDVPNDPDVSHEPYYFGDEFSVNNSDFYADYTEEEKTLYYNLWKEEPYVALKIDITPYELSKINEAYYDYSSTRNSTKADTYRKCNLTITVNGQQYYYEEVGVRMRGNTSRTDFCNDDGFIYGYVHLRFSLTETFDGEEYESGAWGSDIYHEWTNKDLRKERKNRSFATMEKFYYKWNKNYDNTYMREVYTNRMFQAYGILAPHITLTTISLKQGNNFENLGVGNLYETIDKQFLKRNFSSDMAQGDLYKCTYTTDRADLTEIENYGVETPTQRFNYSLKTNDDREAEDYNHNKYLKELINVLSLDKNTSNFKSKLEGLVDMDYFARFEAVNYLVGNPDCIRNNSNNYYLYFLPDTGRVIFIPYDYDRCFGINQDWNPSGNGMIYATPFDTNSCCEGVSNPLYLKTILSSGLSEYQNLFKTKLQEVLDGDWFVYDHFKGIYDEYYKNYYSFAAPSKLIKMNCIGRVDIARFYFSEDGAVEANYNTSSENISVKDYMRIKRQTAENSLK